MSDQFQPVSPRAAWLSLVPRRDRATRREQRHGCPIEFRSRSADLTKHCAKTGRTVFKLRARAKMISGRRQAIRSARSSISRTAPRTARQPGSFEVAGAAVRDDVAVRGPTKPLPALPLNSTFPSLPLTKTSHPQGFRGATACPSAAIALGSRCRRLGPLGMNHADSLNECGALCRNVLRKPPRLAASNYVQ